MCSETQGGSHVGEDGEVENVYEELELNDFLKWSVAKGSIS